MLLARLSIHNISLLRPKNQRGEIISMHVRLSVHNTELPDRWQRESGETGEGSADCRAAHRSFSTRGDVCGFLRTRPKTRGA